MYHYLSSLDFRLGPVHLLLSLWMVKDCQFIEKIIMVKKYGTLVCHMVTNSMPRFNKSYD